MSNSLLPVLPKFSFGNNSVCTYCGDPATSRDHIIPVSFQRNDQERRYATFGPLTGACRDCNSHLGNRWFDTFDARCLFAHNRLDSAATPIIWASHELAHIDYGLRVLIKSENHRRKWLRNRADWYGSRDYWLNIEDLQWRLSEMDGTNPARKFLTEYFRETVLELKQAIYKVEA